MAKLQLYSMTADTTGGNNSSMVLQVDNKIAWTNAISHSYTNDLRDILDYYLLDIL